MFPVRRSRFDFDDYFANDLDFILVLHGHFDHLDKRSIAMIEENVPVVCHPSLEGIVRRSAIQ